MSEHFFHRSILHINVECLQLQQRTQQKYMKYKVLKKISKNCYKLLYFVDFDDEMDECNGAIADPGVGEADVVNVARKQELDEEKGDKLTTREDMEVAPKKQYEGMSINKEKNDQDAANSEPMKEQDEGIVQVAPQEGLANDKLTTCKGMDEGNPDDDMIADQERMDVAEQSDNQMTPKNQGMQVIKDDEPAEVNQEKHMDKVIKHEGMEIDHDNERRTEAMDVSTAEHMDTQNPKCMKIDQDGTKSEHTEETKERLTDDEMDTNDGTGLAEKNDDNATVTEDEKICLNKNQVMLKVLKGHRSDRRTKSDDAGTNVMCEIYEDALDKMIVHYENDNEDELEMNMEYDKKETAKQVNELSRKLEGNGEIIEELTQKSR